MKQAKFFVVIAVFLFFLSGCGDDELPPSPPPPGGSASVGGAIYGMAVKPVWAAEPRNVAVTPQEVFYNDGLIVSASNYDYIYSKAYLFNSKSRVWEQLPLQGEAAQEWLKGQAVGSVAVNTDKFAEGDNYLVVYACSKVAGAWDCNGKKWMLLTFKVKGKSKGAIPELANVDKFVIKGEINPFKVSSTDAEQDNFGDINVIRYDAMYREPKGLSVLVHVFDFNKREELDSTMATMFKDIVNNGWKTHMGSNVALFLAADTNHRVAAWTSGKELVYVETFQPDSASKEIIDDYLRKYPSDLKKQ